MQLHTNEYNVWQMGMSRYKDVTHLQAFREASTPSILSMGGTCPHSSICMQQPYGHGLNMDREALKAALAAMTSHSKRFVSSAVNM